MKKMILLAGAALFVTTPALAQAVDATIEYGNSIDTSLETDSTLDVDVSISADLEFDVDDIRLDSAASAVSDVKQVIEGNDVEFEELDTDGASASNTANGGAVNTSGNSGVNVAAGYYNAQSNVGTIAVSTDGSGGPTAEGNRGGAATASTTGFQYLTDTTYEANDDSGDDADTASDTNNAFTGGVTAAGNAGVNVAAGAFNMQSNVMTLASASDTALASASAGVIQNIYGNTVSVADSVNNASSGGVGGSGNIGVNIAAGVGNMQHNSLTVASGTANGG